MKVRIFIADPRIHADQIKVIRRNLPSRWTLVEEPKNVAAILTENVDISQAMLRQAGPNLRLIARLDTGTAEIPPTSVTVIDLPNTALLGVAELTVLLILALSRHLLSVVGRTQKRKWVEGKGEPVLTTQTRYTYNWIGLEDFGTLYAKTVGIVGLGYIGRAVARRLRPFGVRLLYNKRQRLEPDQEVILGVEWRPLDDLLCESDFVSLHHRFQGGDNGNDAQFGQREFSLMKPTAYLINTARGRLVDENALVDALKTGVIAGAGLDVFRFEPLPEEHPLFQLARDGDNVILTPHIGGAPSTAAWHTIAMEFIQKLAGLV